MNTMSFAHFMTRRAVTQSPCLSYRKLFAAALCDAHRILRLRGVDALVSCIVEAKQIDQRIANEKMIIRKVVKNAISLGYNVSLYDGEEWTVKRTTDASKVMEAVQTTDEDTLRFYTADGVPAGSVFLVYGNSASEVISDYSDTDAISQILAPALARADKLANVGL